MNRREFLQVAAAATIGMPLVPAIAFEQSAGEIVSDDHLAWCLFDFPCDSGVPTIGRDYKITYSNTSAMRGARSQGFGEAIFKLVHGPASAEDRFRAMRRANVLALSRCRLVLPLAPEATLDPELTEWHMELIDITGIEYKELPSNRFNLWAVKDMRITFTGMRYKRV